DRRGGVRRAEWVVFALGALGKAGKSAPLPQCSDAIAPAGEDLMRIGLMAYVPDKAVLRSVEHVMQRHRQLDDPESRPEVTARDRDRGDGFLAQLVGELAELAALQATQVGRRLDEIEERGLGRLRHGRLHRMGAVP